MLDSTVLASLSRHILTAIGGGLAVRYGIDGATVDAIAGGVAAAIGVGWSIYEKRKR